MKVVNYKCSLCEQVWDEENTFGVQVENTDTSYQVNLVDPEDSDKHVCRNCIRAIRDFGEK